jgi:hypothetical protein
VPPVYNIQKNAVNGEEAVFVELRREEVIFGKVK